MRSRPVVDGKEERETRALVLEFFKGDEDKTRLWFETMNPLFGGISPNDLIALGWSGKLLKAVKVQLAENER